MDVLKLAQAGFDAIEYVSGSLFASARCRLEGVRGTGVHRR